MEMKNNLKVVYDRLKNLAPRHFEWVERTGLMGAVRPQTPHRSPRQAFGGNLE